MPANDKVVIIKSVSKTFFMVDKKDPSNFIINKANFIVYKDTHIIYRPEGIDN